MQIVCPKCGTREVRVSRRTGFGEWFQGMFGVYPLRCRRCRNRWLTSVWEGGAWRYARCPQCYRQDLTTWSEQHYHPPKSIVMKLRLGATPYRCAASRCNFASFKACREKFIWRHEEKVDRTPAPKTIPVQELTEEALHETSGSPLWCLYCLPRATAISIASRASGPRFPKESALNAVKVTPAKAQAVLA